MAHGGHQNHRVAGKPMRNSGSGSKGLGVKRYVDKTKIKKKTKVASIKNQIRAVERLLKKSLPAEAQAVQEKRLEDLKKQAEEHQRAELERKMSVRYRRVKFFERRKIERHIKQLEKLLEGPDAAEAATIKENPALNKQLALLKEDLEYVRFFPRTEKYVSLFVGNDDEEVLAKRNRLREQIKANFAAAVASGMEPDDMDDDEDPAMAVSDDDFFLAESSSDNAEADDQFTAMRLKQLSSKTGSIRNKMSKNTAIPSAKHTSASNKEISYKISHNAGSSSKIHKQRPGPLFKNKGLLLDNHRHYSIGADNKVKGQKSDNQTDYSISKDNKIKECIGNQKLKFVHHSSSSLSQSHSRGQQARSQPASSSRLNTASSVIASKDNADSSSVPSHVCADTIKEPTVPEIVPKKRRRKHRPKKRKA